MLTNLCKVGGLYFFLFRLLCISAEAPGQVQLRFHLSLQFLMPAGLLQGKGVGFAAERWKPEKLLRRLWSAK